jgi:ribosome maturation factor RimP
MAPTLFCSLEFLVAGHALDPLHPLIVQELDTLAFDLVELRRGGSKARQVLEIRVERRDGVKVTLEDCTRVSRALEARFDAMETMPAQYVLEVSSPGADRPLRTTAEWRRFVGRRATVTCGALPGGRQEVDILAVEGDEGAADAIVRDDKGVEYRFPLSAVTQARLAFHWKR